MWTLLHLQHTDAKRRDSRAGTQTQAGSRADLDLQLIVILGFCPPVLPLAGRQRASSGDFSSLHREPVRSGAGDRL